MKAAVYQGNRTFALSVSEPVSPGPGEVRLNVVYCGVCGTDVHVYHGAMDGRVGPPQVIGHEASAEVAEIGEGVEGFAPGDRVAVRPLWFGEPTPFDKGHSHVGKNLKFFWSELHMIGARLYEPEDFEEAIRLVANKRLPIGSLITQVSPIEETQSVFETIDANPAGMKYVIQCGEST